MGGNSFTPARSERDAFPTPRQCTESHIRHTNGWAYASARNFSIFSRTVASCSPRSAAWPCTSATTAGGALSTNFLLDRRACKARRRGSGAGGG